MLQQAIEEQWEETEIIIQKATERTIPIKKYNRNKSIEARMKKSEIRNAMKIKALQTQKEEDKHEHKEQSSRVKNKYRQERRTKNDEKFEDMEGYYRRKEIREVKKGRREIINRYILKMNIDTYQKNTIKERKKEYFYEMLNENVEEAEKKSGMTG